MTAPGISTFNGNPRATPPVTTPYRPGSNDFEGSALVDDPKYTPIPGQMPTSALLNTMGAELVTVGRMIPVFRASITHGTAPFINQFVAAPDAPTVYGSATTWVASTAYALNSFIVPQTSTGYYYKATAIAGSGTSGVTPGIFAGITTIGAPVIDNAGGNQITWTCWGPSTFSVYRVSAGKVQITWPANTLPTPVTAPTAYLNGVLTGAHTYGISATAITNGVEIDTLYDGTYTDEDFTVEVW